MSEEPTTNQHAGNQPAGTEHAGEHTSIDSLVPLLATGPLACTISLPVGDGRTAMRRSRLLSVTADGVRVETTDDDRETIRQHIDRRMPILVTVRPADGERLFFSLPVGVSPLNDTVDITTLAVPDKVLLTQRRSYFRVPINPGDDVKIRVWKINNYAILRDRALASQEIFCELLDLGAGGMRISARSRGPNHPLNLEPDQRFRIELATTKKEMLLEGRLRYPNMTGPDVHTALCGVRFVHKDTIESRCNIQTIHTLLAAIQRAAVRNRVAAKYAAEDAQRAA